MKKINFVIVNFNGGQEIIDCLHSLFSIKVPPGWQTKVWVIDNASKDNSFQLIKKNHPKVFFLKNKKNLGFAAAANQGIKKALKNKTDVVLLLNQDALADKDFLKPMLACKADIVSPIIWSKSKKQWQKDFGGKVNWRWGRTFHLPAPENSFDFVSGCAMLIWPRVFEKIGFFDEKFFLYFEDVDFCLRAKKAGLRLAVAKKAKVTHLLKTTKQRSLKQNWQLLQSQLAFINRYLNIFQKPWGYFYWFLLLIKIVAERLFQWR